MENKLKVRRCNIVVFTALEDIQLSSSRCSAVFDNETVGQDVSVGMVREQGWGSKRGGPSPPPSLGVSVTASRLVI